MRKIYFIGLLFCIAFANAQTPKTLNAYKSMLPVQKNFNDYVPASPVVARHQTPTKTYFGKAGATPVKVGETNNDRQANASIYRRLITYPDNKKSVAWMTSSDGPSLGYLSRGTGYNTFDGTSWGNISTLRIEQYRTGYPSFDYSTTMGKEVVFSHKIDTSGKSGGLVFCNNLSVGAFTWTSQVVLDTPSVTTHVSILWPRTAISGNYIHVIANYSTPTTAQPDSIIISGVRQPTVYSRYNISTSSWEVKNITLPGYDSTRWREGSADGYSIDAMGSNVAILMGGLTNDISLWKSTDNGNTWTNKIIDSFPFPAYNNLTPFPAGHLSDTIPVCDGTLNVKLDATGNAHCFWAGISIVWNSSSAALGLFLHSNEINYWYEGRPETILGQIGYGPDITGDSVYNAGTIDNQSRYGNSGAATMPYATVDATGRIFLVYSAITEGDDDGTGHLFRDVYCVYSTDNGSTWSKPINLTGYLGFNTEQMFASLPPSLLGSNLEMTYMESTKQGFYSPTDNSSKLGSFNIMYLETPISQIIENTVGINNVNNETFSVNQNYPNPFTGMTSIPVKLNVSTDVTINIVNLIGQNVYSHKFGKATSGLNNFQVDLSNLNSGVYFYTVEAEGYKITKRMMIE